MGSGREIEKINQSISFFQGEGITHIFQTILTEIIIFLMVGSRSAPLCEHLGNNSIPHEPDAQGSIFVHFNKALSNFAQYFFRYSSAIQVLFNYNLFCCVIKMLSIQTGMSSNITVH